MEVIPGCGSNDYGHLTIRWVYRYLTFISISIRGDSLFRSHRDRFSDSNANDATDAWRNGLLILGNSGFQGNFCGAFSVYIFSNDPLVISGSGYVRYASSFYQFSWLIRMSSSFRLIERETIRSSPSRNFYALCNDHRVFKASFAISVSMIRVIIARYYFRGNDDQVFNYQAERKTCRLKGRIKNYLVFFWVVSYRCQVFIF